MLSSEVDRICSSSVWEETSFCWNKKQWIIDDYNSFKGKHIFLLEENVTRETNLKTYLDDVVVRGRQNFFLFRLGRDFFLFEQKDSKWNDYHSFKHKHIFLLDARTCHVSQNLKNTLTMLSSEVDRISSSSVWEETSFCWKKKTVNELIIILLKTSTFSYWTRTCHVWKSLPIP